MKLTRVIGILSSLVVVGCTVDSATEEERTDNASSALTSARLQIIGIAASDGRPWHGLKYPSVNTPNFNPMAPAVGDIGRISDIDATQMPNGDLQVVAAASGGLFHTVRWTGDG